MFSDYLFIISKYMKTIVYSSPQSLQEIECQWPTATRFVFDVKDIEKYIDSSNRYIIIILDSPEDIMTSPIPELIDNDYVKYIFISSDCIRSKRIYHKKICYIYKYRMAEESVSYTIQVYESKSKKLSKSGETDRAFILEQKIVNLTQSFITNNPV
jgi:hypothetical protein